MRRHTLLTLALVLACEADSMRADAGSSASSAATGEMSTTTEDGSTGGPDSTSATDPSSDDGSDESGVDSGNDDGPGASNPVVLYDGPTADAVVPGWDPGDPRPLILMGRIDGSTTWLMTLASVDADGRLGQNVSDHIIVWGWEAVSAPELLYAGAVAEATISGWDANDPFPVLMSGKLLDTWVATLAEIAPDGSISQNLAEEIRIWGWPGLDLGAPELLYEGSVADGVVPGWDAGAPSPLVMLAGWEQNQAWTASLASIEEAGNLGDNVADVVKLWGW